MITDRTPKIVALAMLLDFLALAFSGLTIDTYLDHNLAVPAAASNLLTFEIGLMLALGFIVYLHRALDRRAR